MRGHPLAMPGAVRSLPYPVHARYEDRTGSGSVSRRFENGGIEAAGTREDACSAAAKSPNSALFKSNTAQNDIPL